MKKNLSVGRSSSRTPFKHWLLDMMLGRIIGIHAKCPWKVPSTAVPYMLIVDQCAGDGESHGTEQTSPSIIERHCLWAKENGVAVKVFLIEKAPNTFRSLLMNVNLDLVQVMNIDARDFILEPTCNNQEIVINCDPNHIDDVPVTEEFLGSLTPTTHIIITLGCNVGGLKRKPIRDRKCWYDLVRIFTGSMPHWHDAILVRLVRDDSQWAYLLRVPDKWSGRDIESIEKKGNVMWPKGVEVASFRRDNEKFESILDVLFLRKNEVAK